MKESALAKITPITKQSSLFIIAISVRVRITFTPERSVIKLLVIAKIVAEIEMSIVITIKVEFGCSLEFVIAITELTVPLKIIDTAKPQIGVGKSIGTVIVASSVTLLVPIIVIGELG